MLRTQSYALGDGNQFPPEESTKLREAITNHLAAMRNANRKADVKDSPLFELVPTWHPAPLPPSDADSFRDDVRFNEQVKDDLDRLRSLGQEHDQFDAVRAELAGIRERILADGTPDVGVMVRLLLVHRSIGDWSGMIDVCVEMPADLARQAPVRQQYAFACNRSAEQKVKEGDDKGAAFDRAKALSTLEKLEEEQGPSPETSGLVGRIYKSQWLRARDLGEAAKSQIYLHKAVNAYARGFETDWRDVYPGINAVTLLEAQGDETALHDKDRLLPVVRFAAEQRLRAPTPDYWDYATMLEALILLGDKARASEMLRQVLASRADSWQLQSTAGNLKIIEGVRRERNEDVGWLTTIIGRLSPAPDGD
jgi:hypothetical protein